MSYWHFRDRAISWIETGKRSGQEQVHILTYHLSMAESQAVQVSVCR